MQTITPFLWFDGKAEQAMHFYCSIFEHAKVVAVKQKLDVAALRQASGQAA